MNSLPEPRIVGLHQLLEHLSDCGCRVAVPLRCVDGTRLVHFRGYLWQMEPWLPGVADFASVPSQQRLTNTMHALAEWHLAAASFVAPAGTQVWFSSSPEASSPAVGERLQKAEQWRHHDLARVEEHSVCDANSEFGSVAAAITTQARLVLPTLCAELAAARNLRVPLQPCLRDIWHDHVLFAGDEVTGIIDPSACRSESVATDLARLLGSLLGDDQQRWHQAMECYATRRPLTGVEHQLVRVLDRSAVVLSPLTWLKRRYLQQTAFDETAVLDRLQQQSQRLLTLTQSLRLF